MPIGLVLIASGAGVMLFGVVMVVGWISGRSAWFGPGVFDRVDNPMSDRWLLYVTFVAVIPGPLLAGALLIVYGLYAVQ